MRVCVVSSRITLLPALLAAARETGNCGKVSCPIKKTNVILCYKGLQRLIGGHGSFTHVSSSVTHFVLRGHLISWKWQKSKTLRSKPYTDQITPKRFLKNARNVTVHGIDVHMGTWLLDWSEIWLSDQWPPTTGDQIHQSINQSIHPSINPLVTQSINQSINQSIKQAIERTIDKSGNQSNNQRSNSRTTINK